MAPSLIANLTAVVTDAMKVAREAAVDKLPAAADAVKSAALAVKDTAMEKLPVAADAVKSAALAVKDTAKEKLPVAADAVKSAALAVKDTVMENLPVAAAAAKSAAGSAAEASEPWVEMAAKLLRVLYGRLVAASAVSVENLREASAAMAKGGAAESTAAWFLLLVLALLAVAFICGVVWALTCRSMKAPGLGGARIPRAMFEANPKRYYATVRAARRAHRDAGTAKWKLLVAAAIVAYTAYLVAKTLNWGV